MLARPISRLQVVPLASAQTYNSGTSCGSLVIALATTVAMETENVKRRHDRANQGSGGHLARKGHCKTVPVQEEIYGRWIALRHRLQTGHDGVKTLCYEQIRLL